MNLSVRIIIIMMACPLFLYAQNNYKPGYIISPKGDTVRGYINYREWNKNPKQFSFRKNPSDAETVFSTSNSKGFGVDGFVYYERHLVSVSRDSIDINVLKVHPEENAITDTVFLKVLTRGSHLVLYEYADDIKRRFYISETGGVDQPQELSYHIYADPDQPSTVKYVNRYRNQLSYEAGKVSSGNGNLQSQIGKAAYNADDLPAVVAKINGGADKQYLTHSEPGARWFAGVGGLYYSLAFDKSSPLGAAPASTGIAPLLGGGIDLFPFQGVQKLYFRVEGSAAYLNYSFSHSDPTATQAAGTISLKMHQADIMLTPQVVYNIYNTERFKIFVDAGVALNFMVNGKHQQVITYTDFPPSITENYPVFDSFSVAFPVKAGVEIGKKTCIYFVYIPSRIIANGINNINGTLSSYGAGLNYYFGSK